MLIGSNHRIEWFPQMIYRMVNGDLQTKIVEAGKFNAGYGAIFLQNFPNSRD